MRKQDHWEGQLEDSCMEYDVKQRQLDSENPSDVHIASGWSNYVFCEADKTDYLVAVSCGVMTGLLDALWVGEFSLSTAQEWGRSKADKFVIKVAQMCGYKKDELAGAIRFLEQKAPIPSDQVTDLWGGGLQHHFRDFAHHASIAGLVFSIMTQFTGFSYGTNTEGHFEMVELSDKCLIGKSPEEKLFNGTVIWALHLVSDMDGSSNCVGKGTGITGTMLSFAKALSTLPYIRDINVAYKGDKINLSIMLSKIFNGTAFEHTSSKDLIRFDLRTELGVHAYSVKQSIPVVINQCLVYAFYFVKRLCIEISNKQIKGITEISKLNPDHFLPKRNRCICRMLTISSGVFCAVDASDAAIRAFIKTPNNKTECLKQFLLRTNFVGIGNFLVSIKKDIAVNMFQQEQDADTERQLVEEGTEGMMIDDITIDVAVEDIDNTKVYEYAFKSMKNRVKETKENVLMSYEKSSVIIKLIDDETEKYHRIFAMSRRQILVEMERLIMRLFTLYGVDYTTTDEIDIFSPPFVPFFREENGKRVGYQFSYSMTSKTQKYDREETEKIKSKYGLDTLKIVTLEDPDKDDETRDICIFKMKKLTGGFDQYMPIKQLFSLISEDEYEVYMTYVRKLNDEIRSIIGYQTIIIPTDNNAIEGLEEPREISYPVLAEWLDQIIGGGMLISDDAKIFFEIGTGGARKWKLELTTISGFEENGNPLDQKYPYDEIDQLRWDRNLEKDEMINKVKFLIMEYLDEGFYKDKLKQYSMIAAGWFGHPEVLYLC